MSKSIKNLTEREKALAHSLSQRKQHALERFPLLFAMLGTFGLVATFYGFEHLIDSVELFSENPFILLGVGVLTLVFTGTLYKKLG